MTIWLILLSGLAYQVGSDIPGYMYEYYSLSFKKINSISDIINFKDNRQPFWVLLEYSCHAISDSFWFFKMVIAIVCNWSISRFIYKHSLYPFVALLFYCLILFFNLNFNALRQSLAIAFFLMGYDSLVEKKWIKYYCFCICALLFHSSAFICFLLPLFHFIPINKKTIVIISAASLVGVFLILRFDMISYAYDFVLNNPALMPEEYADYAENFLEDTESEQANIHGMIFIAFQVILLIIILIANLKLYGEQKSYMLKLFILYLILVILNRTIPIVFMRFLQYFDVFYCCLLVDAIIPLCRRVTRFKLAPYIIIAFFAIIPIRNLMSENKQSGRPLIVQYYPYYSIFNPQIDPQRSMLFGSYRLDK